MASENFGSGLELPGRPLRRGCLPFSFELPSPWGTILDGQRVAYPSHCYGKWSKNGVVKKTQKNPRLEIADPFPDPLPPFPEPSHCAGFFNSLYVHLISSEIDIS